MKRIFTFWLVLIRTMNISMLKKIEFGRTFLRFCRFFYNPTRFFVWKYLVTVEYVPFMMFCLDITLGTNRISLIYMIFNHIMLSNYCGVHFLPKDSCYYVFHLNKSSWVIIVHTILSNILYWYVSIKYVPWTDSNSISVKSQLIY